MPVLIAAGTALVLMIYVIWHRHVRCVDLIEAELRKHHFTGIRSSVALGAISLNFYTFNVRYVDTRGRRHRNRARVHVRDDSADTVHWQHRLERPSSSARRPVEDESDRQTGAVTLEGRLPLISDVNRRHAIK